tara:strand:- start:837 stop:1736 length:900 start_codon:yes stop_codon:yes gene_type:complete
MATGLTLSDTSSLEDMSAIVIADAIANIEPAGPTNQLVTKYPIRQGAKQINLPLWGRLTAAAVTEGIDIAVPQQMSVTVRNLTAGEHGILTFVSDRLQRQNNENVLSEVGTMQGAAMGRLLESDLVTLFDSVSKSSPGAGNALTFYHLAGATSYLRTDNNSSFGPAPGKANAVLHPEQIRRLVQEVTSIQGGGSTGMAAQPIPTGMTEEVVENYFRGNEQVFGTRIWESGVISRDGSNDSKGCMFVPQAFALAMALEVEAEDERDISLRGTEVVMVAEWGESEVVDEWAIELYSATDAL